jgi:hypothetical protein
MRARTQARTCAIISLTTFRMQYLKRAFHNCHIAHSYQLERAAFRRTFPILTVNSTSGVEFDVPRARSVR